MRHRPALILVVPLIVAIAMAWFSSSPAGSTGEPRGSKSVKRVGNVWVWKARYASDGDLNSGMTLQQIVGWCSGTMFMWSAESYGGDSGTMPGGTGVVANGCRHGRPLGTERPLG